MQPAHVGLWLRLDTGWKSERVAEFWCPDRTREHTSQTSGWAHCY